MRNYVQPGDSIDVAPLYTVPSGGGALIGPGLFGIASNDTAVGTVNTFRTVGVYDLGKANVAITAGARIYWDDAARVLTTVAAGNVYIGGAIQAAAAAAATARVRLSGVVI